MKVVSNPASPVSSARNSQRPKLSGTRLIKAGMFTLRATIGAAALGTAGLLGLHFTEILSELGVQTHPNAPLATIAKYAHKTMVAGYSTAAALFCALVAGAMYAAPTGCGRKEP